MGRFRIQFGKREIDLPSGELIVGRGHDCHIRLDSPSVSRHHLRILMVANAVMAYDLDSRNGTWVNDVRLTGPTELKHNDLVCLATQAFKIKEVKDGWGTPTLEDTETFEALRPLTFSDAGDEEPNVSYLGGPQRPTAPLGDSEVPDGEAEPTPDETAKVRALTDEEAFILSTKTRRCPVCGTVLLDSHTHCPTCNHVTYSTPTYRTCPGCRSLIAADDVKCPKCGLSRPPSAMGESASTDRRTAERQEVDVRALYVSSSLTIEEEVINVSTGGVFVTSELLDPVGTEADLVLFKRGRGSAKFTGEVVHVESNPDLKRGVRPGMGIRFTTILPPARRWLDEYLKSEPEG